MEKIDNRRKVAIGKHIDASQVQVFKHAGVLDAKIDEEKEWCVMCTPRFRARIWLSMDEPPYTGNTRVCLVDG